MNLLKHYLINISIGMLGALGLAIYYFTDGIFVSSAIGDDGLSAVTIVWNVIMTLTALAYGLGTGGSIRFSIAFNEKKIKDAKKYLILTFFMVFLLALLSTLFLYKYQNEILYLLGARGNVLKLSIEYFKPIVICNIFQICALAFSPLARNLNGNKTVSYALSIGYLVNTFLCWLFVSVFDFKMLGCALAYIAGQMIISISCVIYIVNYYLKYFKAIEVDDYNKNILQILLTSLAPCGLFLAQAFSSIIIAYTLSIKGGSVALASFSVVVYISSVINALHRSIMDCSQPIISSYYGANDSNDYKKISSYMFVSCLLLVVFGAIFTILGEDQIIIWFNASNESAILIRKYLFSYSLSYILIVMARTFNSYFSAIDKKLQASIITYSEIVIQFILIIILPMFFDVDGIWLSIELSYLIVFLIGLGMLLFQNFKNNTFTIKEK